MASISAEGRWGLKQRRGVHLCRQTQMGPAAGGDDQTSTTADYMQACDGADVQPAAGGDADLPLEAEDKLDVFFQLHGCRNRCGQTHEEELRNYLAERRRANKSWTGAQWRAAVGAIAAKQG